MASPQRCRLFVKANSLLRVLIYSLVVKSVDHAADRDYDFIVCATKCVPEVLATSILLEPLLSRLSSTSQTTIVLLQNGIGIEDDLQDVLYTRNLSHIVIASGCAWVDTTAVDGGRKVTQVGSERLVLGYHRPPTRHSPGKFSEETSRAQLELFCDLLHSGGVTPEFVPDVDAARWRKVLW